MGLKPSHQKGTICEPKMGTKYEPKMVTKYEPKTGTKYEPKMGTKYEPKMGTENHEKISFSYAIGHPGLVPHLFNGNVVPDSKDAPLN